MSLLNFVGTALELLGSVFLASELVVFLRKGPQGASGGQSAAILRQYYADRANRVHAFLAYAGLAAILVGLALQLAAAANNL